MKKKMCAPPQGKERGGHAATHILFGGCTATFEHDRGARVVTSTKCEWSCSHPSSA